MKTVKHIIILFFLTSFSILFSQNLSPVWVKQMGDVGFDGFGENFIQIDNNNNIIIAGLLTNTQIDSLLLNGPFVAKYSPTGDLLWLSLPDTSYNFYPKFFHINQNNEIYILSYSTGNFQQKNTLVKLNNMGEKVWSKVFFTAEQDWGTGGTQYLDFNIYDDSLYLAMNLYSYLALPNNDTIMQESGFNRKYYVFKFDGDCNLHSYFRSFETSTLLSFKMNNNKDTYHYTSAPNPNKTRLIKYDKNYNQMLQVKDFSIEYDRLHLSNNNNLYTSKIGNDDLFDSYPVDSITNNNLFFIKIDNTFENEWIKKFKGFRECPLPNNPNIFKCITHFYCVKTITYNDFVYVYGIFKHKFRIENDIFFSADSSKYSYFITKLDKNGNYFWTEIFESLETTAVADCPFSIMDLKVLENGNLIYGLMFQTQVKIGDSLFISIGDNDIIIMSLQETGVGLKPIKNNAFSFELYPNPANNSVTITPNLEFKHSFSLQIFDITGRCIINEYYKNTLQTINLDISKLKSGLYFVKVQSDSQSSIKKLVVY